MAGRKWRARSRRGRATECLETRKQDSGEETPAEELDPNTAGSQDSDLMEAGS